MRLRTKLALGALAASSALLPATGASSQVNGIELAEKIGRAQDPKAAFAALSPEEQQAVVQATTPAGPPVMVHQEMTPIGFQPGPGEQCWSAFQTWKQPAYLGNIIYTFWIGTSWCGKNGNITRHAIDAVGGETKTPLWKYAGVSDRGHRLLGHKVYQYGAIRFQYGPVDWLSGDRVECAQIRSAAGNGAWASRASCDLN